MLLEIAFCLALSTFLDTHWKGNWILLLVFRNMCLTWAFLRKCRLDCPTWQRSGNMCCDLHVCLIAKCLQHQSQIFFHYNIPQVVSVHAHGCLCSCCPPGVWKLHTLVLIGWKKVSGIVWHAVTSQSHLKCTMKISKCCKSGLPFFLGKAGH